MNEQPDFDNRKVGRRSWYPALLWAAFALVVGTLCLLNSYDGKKSKADIYIGPSEESASTEMVLMGRYSMGAKSTYSDFPGVEPGVLSASLLQQIKNSIRQKTDQVCIIPFIAEFGSRDEVNQYIHELRNGTGLSSALTSDLDQFEMLYQFGVESLPEEVHRRLIKRHQWIAKMALTYGLPSDHPERVSVLEPAIRTFFAAFILMGVVFVGGLSGLVLLVVSMVMVAKKRLRSAFALAHIPVPENPYIFLETTVVFLAMVLLMGLVGRYVPKVVFWCMYIVMMATAVFWPMWRGMDFGPMRRAIGWHRGKGLFRETGAGITGYLAGLPLVGCGCLVTLWIIKKTGVNPVHPIVHQFDDATMFSMIGLVALASIMAPILEETLFRGALYRHLRFRHSALLSALTTGFIFAVIHPQGVAAVPVLGAIGAVFAMIREWRGSLIAPMVAHALNNFLVVMLLMFALMG